MKNEKDEWRAIVKGSPVEPGIPFGYMKRVFRQTLPAVIGAMRLLVQSIESNELNAKGYGLYADFRPENSGWGKKSEMKMTSILALRTAQTSSAPNDGDDDIQASSQELTESAIEASQAERTSTPYRVQLGEGPKEPKRLKLGTEDA
ncbi:hypothetical protein FRC03_000964 [Tulasnella sp. 419]|nr:hypothetical protein FRC03_000964 [Tulasnella sp. 419]